MKSFLSILFCFYLLNHAVFAYDSSVRVGRYIEVAPVPSDSQRNPLKSVVQFKLPTRIKKVGEAINYVSSESGYKLLNKPSSVSARYYLMNAPLPIVFRNIKPIRLDALLKALAGNSWILVVDHVHRLFDFELKPKISKYY